MAENINNRGVEVLRVELAGVREQMDKLVDRFDAQSTQLAEVRDSVVRMETHGYQVQIAEVRLEARTLRDKVLVIETQSKIFAAGVAAGVSIFVALFTWVLAYWMHIPVR